MKEIQEKASDSNIDISDLLRKCLRLAAHLGNEELENWVRQELNGYEDVDKLPKYRRYIPAAPYGDFTDTLGSGLFRNLQIPTINIRSCTYLIEQAL